jgi:uncharacterized membrane protein YczE
MIPIFLPSDSSSGVDIVYPKWVEVIACFGGLVIVVGLLWMLTAFILSIIIDDRIDIMEKPHVYSLALTFFGIGTLIVAVVLMLITGQEVTE